MFSKASLVPFVTLVAAAAASVTIPPLLQEAFVKCSITVSDEALRGAMKYYKCGDFRHLLTDPVFRGPKSGAVEFERCFIERLRMPNSMTIDNIDLEAVIKELKCNSGPMPSDGTQRQESLLSKAGSRFRQFQQRYRVQLDEVAKKVKPEWIQCFNAQRNVSIQEFLCDKDRVEMNKFKECISGDSQDSSVTLPAVPSRLRKITDWILSKVICKSEPRNVRINKRSTFSETMGDLAEVLASPAIGTVLLIALCGVTLPMLLSLIIPWQLLAVLLTIVFLNFASLLLFMGLSEY